MIKYILFLINQLKSLIFAEYSYQKANPIAPIEAVTPQQGLTSGSARSSSG